MPVAFFMHQSLRDRGLLEQGRIMSRWTETIEVGGQKAYLIILIEIPKRTRYLNRNTARLTAEKTDQVFPFDGTLNKNYFLDKKSKDMPFSK